MNEGQIEAVSSEERVVPDSELKVLKKRIHEFERVPGWQTLTVESLKEAVRIGREKKTDVARAIGRSAFGGPVRFRIKQISDAAVYFKH